MPLLTGTSKADVSGNIRTLLTEGRPRAQSIAIALSKAGRSNKPKRPKLTIRKPRL